MTRILICEDDNAISDLLARLLRREGYRCEQVYSGTEALRLLASESYDLILLDLILPGKSGEDILALRSDETPVIVLSAKNEMRNRLDVLRLGADDFIDKPFHNEELLLRIRALLRRSERSEKSRQKLELSGLCLDRQALTVLLDGVEISLTPSEFKILEQLMLSPERVFTKNMLYQLIWGYDDSSDENVINIHVSHLRKKLRVHSDHDYIKTIWGLGLRFQAKS